MKISALDRAFYFKQLAELIGAAFPLSQALTLIHQHHEHPLIKKALTPLLEQLNQGKRFSQAAAHEPTLFSPYAQELIQLGEHTGTLDECLTTLAAVIHSEHTLKQQIKNALFYPCLLFITSSFFIVGLIMGVVPQFEKIFQPHLATLPVFTLGLFWLSHHGWIFLISAIFVISLFFLWQKTNSTASFTTIFFKLPVLHTHWRRYHYLQFLNAFAHALKAGLPIDTTLKLSSNVTQDPALQSSLRTLRRQLHQGIPLHQAMQAHPCFPKALLPFVQTGEATGQLDRLIHFAYLHFHTHWQQQLIQSTRLLEPLILLIQGALIGGVVIGLYLPIFNLGTLL